MLNPPRSCCTILKMWDLVKQFKKSVILTKRNHGYLLTFHDVIHIKLKELIAHRTRIRTPLPPTFSISWNKQEDLPPVLTLYAKNVVSTLYTTSMTLGGHRLNVEMTLKWSVCTVLDGTVSFKYQENLLFWNNLGGEIMSVLTLAKTIHNEYLSFSQPLPFAQIPFQTTTQ